MSGVFNMKRQLLFKLVIFLLKLYLIIVVIYVSKKLYDAQHSMKFLDNGKMEAKPLWVKLVNMDSYVYSAIVYLPTSQGDVLDVRVTILDGDNMIGLVCCFLGSSNKIFQAESTTFTTFQYPSFQYVAKQFSCRIPKFAQPSRIFFSVVNCQAEISDPIFILYPKQNENKVAFCTKAAFGNLSSRVLVEYIELHWTLGVNKIVVHNLNLKPQNRKILEGYQKAGVVEIVDIDFPGNTSKLNDKKRKQLPLYADAQLAVFDCISRMSGYSYIGIIDFDEILLPSTKYKNISQLLNELSTTYPHAASFRLGVEIFPKNWGISNNNTPIESMQYIQRLVPEYSHAKCVHIPGRVDMVWTHDAGPLYGYKRYDVPFEMATLHHYRYCRNGKSRFTCINSTRITDKQLLLLENTVTHRINNVLKTIA